jgi:hypothetical protein
MSANDPSETWRAFLSMFIDRGTHTIGVILLDSSAVLTKLTAYLKNGSTRADNTVSVFTQP